MSPNPPPVQQLTTQASAAVELAALLVERDKALLDLLQLLDPDGSGYLCPLAELIAAHLADFSDKAALIERGRCKPSGDFEQALLAVYRAPGPATGRNLYELLRELRPPRKKKEFLSWPIDGRHQSRSRGR